jgi:ABC-type transporter Mla subunit MlaD
MDLLDQIHPASRDLLDRVDATLLAAGAPDDHRIWPLLRRVGALPGEVTGQLAATTPEGLAAAAVPLRERADGYQASVASVPAVAAWRGPAAEGFAAQWSTLSGHLAGDDETMAGRLRDTVRFLDDVTGWLTRARRELAGALAECLGSAQAAVVRALPGAAAGPDLLLDPRHALAAALAEPLKTGVHLASGSGAPTPREAVTAAATIGAHLLATVAEIIDEGQRTLDDWAGRLSDLPYPTVPGPPAGIPAGGRLEIG